MASFFEKQPHITLAAIMLCMMALGVVAIEYVAKHLLGLGKVVVYEANSLYGYRPIPNQHLARKATQVIHINNMGLRADHDWDINQKDNKILFLGDSVTYGGSYIDNHETFAYQATKPFTGYESGNAGVNAWGVLNVYALVHNANFLPAKTVVSTFPEGDFLRGMTRIGGQPFWTHTPQYGLEELFQYGIYKLQLHKTNIQTKPQEQSIQTQTKRIAVKALKALDAKLPQDTQHLIYISPTINQALGKDSIDTELQQMLAQENVPAKYIIDKFPSQFTPEQITALFHDNIHLNVQGHKLWGEIMAQDLAKILT